MRQVILVTLLLTCVFTQAPAAAPKKPAVQRPPVYADNVQVNLKTYNAENNRIDASLKKNIAEKNALIEEGNAHNANLQKVNGYVKAWTSDIEATKKRTELFATNAKKTRKDWAYVKGTQTPGQEKKVLKASAKPSAKSAQAKKHAQKRKDYKKSWLKAMKKKKGLKATKKSCKRPGKKGKCGPKWGDVRCVKKNEKCSRAGKCGVGEKFKNPNSNAWDWSPECSREEAKNLKEKSGDKKVLKVAGPNVAAAPGGLGKKGVKKLKLRIAAKKRSGKKSAKKPTKKRSGKKLPLKKFKTKKRHAPHKKSGKKTTPKKKSAKKGKKPSPKRKSAKKSTKKGKKPAAKGKKGVKGVKKAVKKAARGSKKVAKKTKGKKATKKSGKKPSAKKPKAKKSKKGKKAKKAALRRLQAKSAKTLESVNKEYRAQVDELEKNVNAVIVKLVAVYKAADKDDADAAALQKKQNATAAELKTFLKHILEYINWTKRTMANYARLFKQKPDNVFKAKADKLVKKIKAAL